MVAAMDDELRDEVWRGQRLVRDLGLQVGPLNRRIKLARQVVRWVGGREPISPEFARDDGAYAWIARNERLLANEVRHRAILTAILKDRLRVCLRELLGNLDATIGVDPDVKTSEGVLSGKAGEMALSGLADAIERAGWARLAMPELGERSAGRELYGPFRPIGSVSAAEFPDELVDVLALGFLNRICASCGLPPTSLDRERDRVGGLLRERLRLELVLRPGPTSPGP